MSRTLRPRTQCFIGDDLIIVAKFTRSELDITPYTITAELRDAAGLGAVVGTLNITKDDPNLAGESFGVIARLPNSVTQGLTVGVEYGLDFKFVLNSEIQHTPRLLVEFLASATV
jgi:hypothetical protein